MRQGWKVVTCVDVEVVLLDDLSEHLGWVSFRSRLGGELHLDSNLEGVESDTGHSAGAG